MKKIVRTLALSIALFIAFGTLTFAGTSDLPADLANLPKLTTGVTVQGTISGVLGGGDPIWYSFTPVQDGYYNFPTTGGYDSCKINKTYGFVDDYDYLIVEAVVYSADGEYLTKDGLKYTAGRTYYIALTAYHTSDTKQSVNFTMTPTLYQYSEPLKQQKIPMTLKNMLNDDFFNVNGLLKDSKYTLKDVAFWEPRGCLYGAKDGHEGDHTGEILTNNNYNNHNFDSSSPGYVYFYFHDGTYTVVNYTPNFDLITIYELVRDTYEAGGISAVMKMVTGDISTWLGFIPMLPVFGIIMSFFFAPFSGFTTLITLLPLSIIALPFGLLFLPFSLISGLFN